MRAPMNRRRWLTPTSALLVGAMAGFAGFYGGVREEKANATGSGTPAPATSRAAASDARSAAGAGRTAGSFAGVITGTVSRVSGSTGYVEEASGSTVKVKLIAATTIRKSRSASEQAVRPGDSVTVQGTQERGGTIKSSSISDAGDDSTATSGQTGAASSSAG